LKSIYIYGVIALAGLAWYASRQLKKASNANTSSITQSSKGPTSEERLITTPLKPDLAWVAPENTLSLLPYASGPRTQASLSIPVGFDRFQPYGNVDSASAAYYAGIPPEAKPTSFITA
jgi:hypothetical protein